MAMILGRLVGLALGVAVGLIICLIAFRKMNKNGKIKTEYDERQTEIRGKAYTLGFWTEAAYMAVLMLLDLMEINIPAEKMVIYFFGVVLGVTVLCSYCIWNGAYFGINNDKKKWTIFFAVFTVINLALGVMMCRDGELAPNGILGAGCINLLCGLMLLVVLIVLLIKRCIEKKESDIDEES